MDRWLIICIASFATVAVWVWGIPAHPQVGWRQKMLPIITMVLGVVIFSLGALWYSTSHPKPKSVARALSSKPVAIRLTRHDHLGWPDRQGARAMVRKAAEGASAGE